MEERVPPQNIEAEQSVLGAMLIDKEARDYPICNYSELSPYIRTRRPYGLALFPEF